MTAETTQPSRAVRKRERTRDTLLTAMQLCLLEKGYEKTNISDLTEQADVGLGTFYNYYDSKADILAAVIQLVLRNYHLEVDQVTAGLEDPAERLAASMHYTFNLFCDTAGFSKLLFESGVPLELYANDIRERAKQDMQAGIDKNRFQVNDLMITLNMITGSTLYSGADLYRGNMAPSAIPKIIENFLLLVGMSSAEAKRISQIEYPLPAKTRFPISLIALNERERELKGQLNEQP
ncbi:TetR/AcrR family transcriptional regulator [Pseudomonas zhanjiangensis]|uniref:TetR/AcrR family transcriptional regulator n=1 Tax=Pseudomonas zhanjiangensis TaxID=3239015 RepID=A0ABV3YU05_9PSED